MGEHNRPILITLGVIAMLIVAYLIYVGMAPEEAPAVVQKPLPVPGETAAPSEVVAIEPVGEMPDPMAEPEEQDAAEPLEETTPAFSLPKLDDSDALMRDGVVRVTAHAGIERWLAGSDLIRKLVAIVDSVARGALPRQHLAVFAPEGPFLAGRESEQIYLLDEASYRRFDFATAIFASIDTRSAVDFYTLLRPLFQQAYAELGYGDGRFDDVIFVAIGRLLETPTPPAPIRLVRPAVYYEFAEPRLEKLSDAQKQLIRMGPENTRAIQAKLSDFALELRTVLRM